jgi:trehalose synthase
MQRVAVQPIALEAYRDIVPDAMLADIATLGRALRGLCLVHVNATPAGGGVAEILKSLVGLMQGIGLDARWYVLEADPAFYQITKKLHHALQGGQEALSEDDMARYLAHMAREAASLEAATAGVDLWIVHDPQPLPIRHHLHSVAPAVWVCHVDTTQPDVGGRQFLLPYIRDYQRLVFSLPEYVFDGLDPTTVAVIPPAIDPLLPKNKVVPVEQAKAVLARLGIDPGRPLVTQVSRFDRWKDPWGVVEAYRLARRKIPELQLALVGVMTARDDPEALEVFQSVQSYIGDDPNIHVFTDPRSIGDLEVNAFQRGSEVILQKSLREGFGLTVAEAMWKGTPVIGGDCGGIRLQIRDGETGFLVPDVFTCAARIVELITNPTLARRLGEAGRASVQQHYLLPRLLLDYLELTAHLVLPTPVGTQEGLAMAA